MQCISAKFDPQELTTEKALLLQAQSHLAKSIAASMNSYAEEVSTKHGAVVLHLDIDHGDILEFIETPREELPWAKRCVNIWDEAWANTSQATRDALLKGIARGDIWLAKRRFDQHGERIYANVCLEVFLKSRGTCLLEHINLAAVEVSELPQAFADGMTELCELHSKTGVESTGEYLPQSMGPSSWSWHARACQPAVT